MLRVRAFAVVYVSLLGLFSLWVPVVATDRVIRGACLSGVDLKPSGKPSADPWAAPVAVAKPQAPDGPWKDYVAKKENGKTVQVEAGEFETAGGSDSDAGLATPIQSEPPFSKGYSFIGNPVRRGDIFDQLAPGDVLEQSVRADSVFAGRLAWGVGPHIIWSDDGLIAEETWIVDWARYTRRAFVIFVVVLLLYTDWRAVSRFALEPAFVVAPLACVAVGGVARFLYVPCKVVVRRAYQRVPEVATYSTVPVWRVGAESIRYDVIVYEEFLLLFLVVLTYGLAWLLLPRIRSYMRSWVRSALA